ncbi:MAG: hypothetical protein JW937_04820 [Candidatus Omnitrophica bacterium]|nr:hypothetical protein [Candidatus Omnitrophota bacterium]
MSFIPLAQLLDSPVYSISEGKVLGRVVQSAVEADPGRVSALLVDDMKAEEALIRVEDIETFGIDALMIRSEENLTKPVPWSEVDQDLELGGRINGVPVLSKSGERLDLVVISFFFRPGSGEITHFEVSGGLLRDMLEGKGLLPREGVISIGPDALIVTEDAQTIVETIKAGPSLIDSAKRLKQQVGRVFEDVK